MQAIEENVLTYSVTLSPIVGVFLAKFEENGIKVPSRAGEAYGTNGIEVYGTQSYKTAILAKLKIGSTDNPCPFHESD